jgi:GNAT superfamily N-acetyltransferase
MTHELRQMTTSNDLKTAFEVLKELRTNLEFAEFLAIYDKASTADRYTLVGCFVGNACVAVMGYRVLFDFVHGAHLYVDDLVTTEKQRSKGHGKLLLKYAEDQARAQGLAGLRLCTGVDNDAGKRFYEREGWQLRSVAYKKKLKEGT